MLRSNANNEPNLKKAQPHLFMARSTRIIPHSSNEPFPPRKQSRLCSMVTCRWQVTAED